MIATSLRRSSRLVPAATLAAALAAQAPPALPTPVQGALPASTYACVHFGGFAACREATGELPLADVVTAFLARIDPSLRERHVERALEGPANGVRNVLGRVHLQPDDVRAVLSRPMTLALGRLSVEGMGPSLALVIDEGGKRREIERCFGVVEQLAAAGGAGGTAAMVDVGGVALRRFETAAGVPIFHGSIGGRFVVSNSRGYVRELIEVARGGGRSLAATGAFAPDASDGPPLAALLVDTAPFADALAPFLPYEADDWSAALGVGRLASIEASIAASPRGGSDRLRIGLHGSKDGLLKALVARPVDLGFASMCTNDTVLFAAGSLDLPAVSAAFERVVALLPAAARLEAQRQMARGLHAPELAAALASFGPRVALAVAAAKGGVPKPEVLLRVEVRDRAAAAQLLQRLERAVANAARCEWKSRAIGDREVRFCTVEIQDANVQLAPCYALLDDGVVFGSDVASLVRALRPDADAAAALAAQDDFVAMAKATNGSSGVVHVRSFRAVELGWRTVESWVFPLVDQNADQLGFDSDALPDTETMARALGTSTISFRVDDDGIEVRHHGTLAAGAWFASFGALVDEVLLRASTRTY